MPSRRQQLRERYRLDTRRLSPVKPAEPGTARTVAEAANVALGEVTGLGPAFRWLGTELANLPPASREALEAAGGLQPPSAPTTAEGRYGQSIGEMAGYGALIGPMLSVAAPASVARATGSGLLPTAARTLLGPYAANPVGTTAADVLAAGAAGAGVQAVRENVEPGTPWRGAAELAVGLGAGLGAVAAPRAARAAGGYVWRRLPGTQPYRAGRELDDAAAEIRARMTALGDPEGFAEAQRGLVRPTDPTYSGPSTRAPAGPPEPRYLTAGQAFDDPGLTTLTRELAQGEGGPQFMGELRRRSQAAQTDLAGRTRAAAPPGSPDDVGALTLGVRSSVLDELELVDRRLADAELVAARQFEAEAAAAAEARTAANRAAAEQQDANLRLLEQRRDEALWNAREAYSAGRAQIEAEQAAALAQARAQREAALAETVDVRDADLAQIQMRRDEATRAAMLRRDEAIDAARAERETRLAAYDAGVEEARRAAGERVQPTSPKQEYGAEASRTLNERVVPWARETETELYAPIDERGNNVLMLGSYQRLANFISNYGVKLTRAEVDQLEGTRALSGPWARHVVANVSAEQPLDSMSFRELNGIRKTINNRLAEGGKVTVPERRFLAAYKREIDDMIDAAGQGEGILVADEPNPGAVIASLREANQFAADWRSTFRGLVGDEATRGDLPAGDTLRTYANPASPAYRERAQEWAGIRDFLSRRRRGAELTELDSSMSAYLIRDAYETAGLGQPGREPSAAKLAQWRERNRYFLEQYPEVERQLGSLESAQAAAEQLAARRTSEAAALTEQTRLARVAAMREERQVRSGAMREARLGTEEARRAARERAQEAREAERAARGGVSAATQAREAELRAAEQAASGAAQTEFRTGRGALGQTFGEQRAAAQAAERAAVEEATRVRDQALRSARGEYGLSRTELESSIPAQFAGDDGTANMRAILDAPDPVNAAAAVMLRAGNDENARRGLGLAIWNTMVDDAAQRVDFSAANLSKGSVEVMDSRKIMSYLDRYEPLLRAYWSDAHYENMRKIGQTLRLSQGHGVGDTTRPEAPQMGDLADNAQALFDAFVISTHPLLSAHPARVTRSANWFARKIYETVPDEVMNAILRRAMLEPEYAATLAARVPARPETVRARAAKIFSGWTRRTAPIAEEQRRER